ncbi:MAG: hydroxyacid dehydrogenase [Chloroflexota bacterium]
MKKIWFQRPLPTEFLPLFDGIAEPIGPGSDTPDDPFSTVEEAAAVIAGGLQYGSSMMDRAPHLKVIARTGIGVDNVDIPAATERGIAVCNAPDAPTIATAEHAIALMFAVARRFKWNDNHLIAGNTLDYFGQYNALELFQAELGLVGLGRIASHVATIARGIGMTVTAYDPFISPERAAALGVTLHPTLESLLQTADVVSLHVPLLPETQDLINAETLALMKSGAILINAARGGLVDEAALVDALEQGHLRGAGLDVFKIEPPPADHPLVGREDVVATPHVASATVIGRKRLWRDAIVQAVQVIKGERPTHLLNPEVWPG